MKRPLSVMYEEIYSSQTGSCSKVSSMDLLRTTAADF